MNKRNTEWTKKAKDISTDLHNEITIKNEEWHIFRNNPQRRSAELLTAAIVQLLRNGSNKEVLEKIELSLRWLKNEIKDPGCSGH